MGWFLIPFGKGTGKLWILAVIVITVLTVFVFKYEDLIIAINSGQITNPAIIILVRVIYPIYAGVMWSLNFLYKWGILAVIPIIIVIILGFWLFDKVIEVRAKRRRK